MTIAIDSEIPISQPWIYITARTLTMTTPTQKSDTADWKRFLVAIKRIVKAKIVAIVIPLKAEDIKAFSVGIQAQP